MRKRNIGFVAAALLAAGCTSINPVPPQAPGTDWTRYELAQGATPNERRSPRVKVSGRSNLTGPRLLAGETFRYRVDLNVEDGLSKVALTCLQGSDPAEFRCGDDRSAFMALALTDHCGSGTLSSGGRAYAVKNWFSKATHVGFLVSDGERPVGAIDTDHPWTMPVWATQRLNREELVALDVLAYVMNDILLAEERAGVPFLCGSLSSSRRYPR